MTQSLFMQMDVVITSDLLQWVFKRYGNVENVVLKKYQVDEVSSIVTHCYFL